MESTCRLLQNGAISDTLEKLEGQHAMLSRSATTFPSTLPDLRRKKRSAGCLSAAASGPTGFSDSRRLHQAAADFERNVKEKGLDPDEAIAKQLGLGKASDMTELQEKYKDKIKDRLANYQELVNQQKALRNANFERGKFLYGRGNYTSATVYLRQALDEEGPFTAVGGDIQMWLALAYEACGHRKECIQVYKDLENSHPMPAVRRQAADIRYILEAPKLTLSPDEYVKIPILENADRYQPARAAMSRPRPPKQGRAVPKSREELFWENYRPPLQLPQNRYVLVASAMLLLGLACYSATL